MPVHSNASDIRQGMNYDTGRGFVKQFDTNDWLNGDPYGGTVAFETYDRRIGTAAVTPTGWTTGILWVTRMPLPRAAVVTNLSFRTGATAVGTPANWWFGLWDPDGTLMAQTADQTSTAWATTTTKTLALSAVQTTTRTGLYYAGVMVKATTMPTILAAPNPLAAVGGGLVTTQAVGAAVTTATYTTTAPATLPTLTATGEFAYCVGN